MKEYTKTNEWIDAKDGIATIGLTKEAIEDIGDVVNVELPETGKEIQSGEPLFTVESAKAVNTIYSPISGIVVEVNDKLKEDPETIISSPEDEGWIVKLKL